MKKIIMMLSFLFFHPTATADDYKSAQRFTEGDVVSAEVLNDILDRIELSLTTIKTEDLIGSWQVKWITCINGGPGNCGDLKIGAGWEETIDALYRYRRDTWTISDDKDGTYSVRMAKYCIMSNAAYSDGTSVLVYYNLPCEARLSLVSGLALFGYVSSTGEGGNTEIDGHSRPFMNVKKVSDTRYEMTNFASASSSFLILQLDKLETAPSSVTGLSAQISSNSIVLNWGDLDGEGLSYGVERRSRGKEESKFAEIAKVTESTYTDSK